jgi:hypothetical protein
MRALAAFAVLLLVNCSCGPTPEDVAGVYDLLGNDGRPILWEEYPDGVFFWEFNPDGTYTDYHIMTIDGRTSGGRVYSEGDTISTPGSYTVGKGQGECVEVHFVSDALPDVQHTATVCGDELFFSYEQEGEVFEQVWRKRY